MENKQLLRFDTQLVLIDTIKPHPKNYRKHPEDQLQHIIKSIEQHGFYRNVVVSEDGFILAGHGVVDAMKRLGYDKVPVVRLPIKSDSTEALKLIVGDNEISGLGESDDRQLSELLKEIQKNLEGDLLGTGYDDKMLSNLVFITRPASEIKDKNDAAAWSGLTDYDESGARFPISIQCATAEDREALIELLQIKYIRKGNVYNFKWPNRPNDDISSLMVEG